METLARIPSSNLSTRSQFSCKREHDDHVVLSLFVSDRNLMQIPNFNAQGNSQQKDYWSKSSFPSVMSALLLEHQGEETIIKQQAAIWNLILVIFGKYKIYKQISDSNRKPATQGRSSANRIGIRRFFCWSHYKRRGHNPLFSCFLALPLEPKILPFPCPVTIWILWLLNKWVDANLLDNKSPIIGEFYKWSSRQ